MPLTLLDNFTIVISALRVIPSKISPCADIAQLVEQRIRNAKVVGSTPIIGTISTSTCVYQNQQNPSIIMHSQPFIVSLGLLT